MQIKTINKNISSKVNEWLSSIDDLQLRKDLLDNVLVSGGSIASMLLGVDVNDYDLYIMDRSVLLRLTQYYTKGLEDVSILDGTKYNEYVAQIEADYQGINTPFEKMQGARISAVRTLKPDQIKLYFDDKTGGKRFDTDTEPERKYQLAFLSANAISLTDKIQIVIRFHGDADKVHETFDYIHATNYWTNKTGVKTNIQALESLLTKQLKYQGSFFPITSVIRMGKFLKRGWNINAGDIFKMCLQIGELDLKNPDVLEEQIIGVDVAYFEILIQDIREVPREKLNAAYIFEIIDRVFSQNQDTEE